MSSDKAIEPLWLGAAKRIEDIDLPRIGATIGVGEDPLHALIEVETRGSGFDKQKRVIMLFEPHRLFANLKGPQRRQAVAEGLAYANWGEQPYPKDSYPRFIKACAINETAAYKSCSWGMAQIMGENYSQVGYDSPQAMVKAFADDEDNHLEAMVDFLIANHIDDDLRRIEEKTKRGEKVTATDWIPVVRVYNGKGFAKNNYHNRAAQAYNRWLRIKDTPYSLMNLKEAAAREEVDHETAAARGELTFAGNSSSAEVKDTIGEQAKIDETAASTAPVIAVAPVEATKPPVEGGGVADEAKQVSKPWTSRITGAIGAIVGLGASLKGLVDGDKLLLGIGIVCVTVIVLALIFRSVLLDWLRMKLHADPSQINVK